MSARPGPTPEQIEQATECLARVFELPAEDCRAHAPELAQRWLDRAYAYGQQPLELTDEQRAARAVPENGG